MTVLLSVAFASSPVVGWDLAGSDGGLTATGLAFAWGEVSSGPGEGYTGSNAWATRLDGDYFPESEDTLQLPAWDLTGLMDPVLELHHWLEVDAGDCASFEAWDGDAWAPIEPIYGYGQDGCLSDTVGHWEPRYLSVAGLDDLSSLRLLFVTDTSVQLAGWYVDDITLYEGDSAPPLFQSVSELETTDDVEGPYEVSVSVVDDIAVTSVSIVYTVDAADEQSVSMTLEDDGSWSGGLPGQLPDSSVAWWVVASDGVNESRSPALGEERRFRVRLPAPTELSVEEPSRVVGEEELSWTAPSSRHELLYYNLYRDGLLVDTVEAEAVSTQVGPEGLDFVDFTIELSGVFEVLGLTEPYEGDRSEAYELAGVVPGLLSVEPAEVYAGDSVRVEVVGSYLLFTEGELHVDFGSGVSVVAVDVDSVDRALIELEVAEDATTSTRAVSGASGTTGFSLENAFTVEAADERPHVVSVSPESVMQGETATLEIVLSEAIEELSGLSAGDEVVVESMSFDGDVVFAEVAVGAQAALGDRAVLVDDGTRLLSGQTLRIADATLPPSSGCGTGGAGLWWLGLLALRRRG